MAMQSPRPRRRIKSISGTAQITKAMQMVAASKMRKAQQAALAARPFAQLLYRIQRSATARLHEFAHPLLEVRAVRRRAVILIAGDKGLCGALNTNVFRLAAQFDPESTIFITAGRKAAQFVARTRRQLAAEFAYGDTPTSPRPGRSPRSPATSSSRARSTRCGSSRRGSSTRSRRRPSPSSTCRWGRSPTCGYPTPRRRRWPRIQSETVFEPSAEAVLGYLLGHYLNIYVYYVLLNAKASEQSARMVSMKNATDSAESLIEDLTLEYNKLRQGNITRELLEIAGGQAE